MTGVLDQIDSLAHNKLQEAEVTALITTDAAYRLKLDKEFNTLWASDAWNTAASILFLTEALQKLEEKNVIVTTKIEELGSANITERKRQHLESALIIDSKQLSNDILSCNASLLERKLTLYPSVFAKIESSNRGLQSFQDDWLIFCDPQTAATVSLDQISSSLINHQYCGLNGSAGDGLNRLICQEVVRRIDNHKIEVEDNTDLKEIMRFFATNQNEKNHYADYHKLLFISEYKQYALKAQVFKMYYHALRNGQSGWLKSNFLADKENFPPKMLVDEIEVHRTKNAEPDKSENRTATAWRLTQRYYSKYSLDSNQQLASKNPLDQTSFEALFNETYDKAFEKSGLLFGFFKKSCVTGSTILKGSSLSEKIKDQHITVQQIEQRAALNEKSRSAIIFKTFTK